MDLSVIDWTLASSAFTAVIVALAGVVKAVKALIAVFKR